MTDDEVLALLSTTELVAWWHHASPVERIFLRHFTEEKQRLTTRAEKAEALCDDCHQDHLRMEATANQFARERDEARAEIACSRALAGCSSTMTLADGIREGTEAMRACAAMREAITYVQQCCDLAGRTRFQALTDALATDAGRDFVPLALVEQRLRDIASLDPCSREQFMTNPPMSVAVSAAVRIARSALDAIEKWKASR